MQRIDAGPVGIHFQGGGMGDALLSINDMEDLRSALERADRGGQAQRARDQIEACRGGSAVSNIVNRTEQITEQLLVDAQTAMDKEGRGGEIVSRQIRGLAAAVAKHLAAMESVIDQRTQGRSCNG